MYLSTLLINTGADPDRPRPGRLWLRNLYRVHQRLCMAFPSEPRRTADGPFLQPYDPADFPEDRHLADRKPSEVPVDVLRHVHARRDEKSGFLFRVDPQRGGRAVIVVLSAPRPDWDYAFQNARHLLASPPSPPRTLNFKIEPGDKFGFKLQANPTKRPPLTKKEWKQKKDAGAHVPRPRRQLTWSDGDDPTEVFKGWLRTRAEHAGFRLLDDRLHVSSIGYVYIRKGGSDDKGQRLRSVHYQGDLEVTQPENFRRALQSGIGPAKAFGFGLLSIKPVR